MMKQTFPTYNMWSSIEFSHPVLIGVVVLQDQLPILIKKNQFNITREDILLCHYTSIQKFFSDCLNRKDTLLKI